MKLSLVDASLWYMCLSRFGYVWPFLKLYLCLVTGVRSHGENLYESQPLTGVNSFNNYISQIFSSTMYSGVFRERQKSC